MVEAQIDVAQSTWRTNCVRAGYSFGVSDGQGRAAAVLLVSSGTQEGIALLTEGCIGTALYDFPTSGFNTYRLVVAGYVASVYVNGSTTPVVTMPTPVYYTPSGSGQVHFGDPTNIGASETSLKLFRWSPFEGVHADGHSLSAASGGSQELYFEAAAHPGKRFAHRLEAAWPAGGGVIGFPFPPTARRIPRSRFR